MQKENGTHTRSDLRRTTIYILGAIVLLGITIAASCRHKTDDYRADGGIAPCEITEPLDKLFAPMFPEDCPGAIAAVMRDGKIVYQHSFGLSRMDEPQRITDSTVFNIASGSKTFASVALLKLNQDPNVDIQLDDPLSKYFPEFPRKIFDKIKVIDIMNQTSGLPELRPRNTKEWDEYLSTTSSVFIEAPDFRLFGTEEEHMKVFALLDSTDYEPSVHYQRTDPALVLLAPLIERVTGQKYDLWMKENIFGPAGLHETSYYGGIERYKNRLTHGYRAATVSTSGPNSPDSRWEEYDYGEADFFLTKADRGAFSSVRDILSFRKQLFDGKIIADSMLELYRRPSITVPTSHDTKMAMGMGLRIRPDYPVALYHCDYNGGYRYIEVSYPDIDLHYVVMATRSNWDGNRIIDVVDSILKVKEWL